MKTLNKYSDRFPKYKDTPKAVAAAIAFSLAMRLCGDDELEAQSMLRTEWKTLFDNEIVPQKPPFQTGIN